MKTNDEIKLLPCAHCGGRADIAMDLGMIYYHYLVKCVKCGANVPTQSPNKETAIEQWNSRVIIPSVNVLLDAMIKARCSGEFTTAAGSALLSRALDNFNSNI